MNQTSESSRREIFFYTMGIATGFVILGLVAIAGYLLYPRLHNRPQSVLHLPENVKDRLQHIGAVIGNAGNPLNVPRHDSILVKPDPGKGYCVRPNIAIWGDILKARNPYNIDPPIIYLPSDRSMPLIVTEYLRNQSRQVPFTIRTDSNGYRQTEPVVAGQPQVVILGDSVAFGVNVDDNKTIASYLQARLGRRLSVINMAVGNYGVKEMLVTATEAVQRFHDIRCFVYVACQNDLWNLADLRKAVSGIDEIASNKGLRIPIIMLLHTYMEYCLKDFFGDKGWPGKQIAHTDKLREEAKILCKQYKVSFIDWTNIVYAFKKAEGSWFAPFALYSDHCHLSPRGNKLAAKAIFAKMASSMNHQGSRK